jgi:hypothetical protein
VGEQTEVLKLIFESGKEDKVAAEALKATLGLGEAAAPIVEEITQLAEKLKVVSKAGDEADLLAKMSDKVTELDKMAKDAKNAGAMAKCEALQKAIAEGRDLDQTLIMNAEAQKRIAAARKAANAHPAEGTPSAPPKAVEAPKATAAARPVAEPVPAKPSLVRKAATGVADATEGAANRAANVFAKHPVAITVGAAVVPPAVGVGYYGLKAVHKVAEVAGKAEKAAEGAVNKLQNLFNGHSGSAVPPDVFNVTNADGTPNLDDHGNPVKGREQTNLSRAPSEDEMIRDNKTGKFIMGKDGKPLVRWNPAQEEPGILDSMCKWISGFTEGWDPTWQRIALAAVPLIGGILGGSMMPGIFGGIIALLGVGLAILTAWKGPSWITGHADTAKQHDNWVNTHPAAQPFNNASDGTATAAAKPQPQTRNPLAVPAPAH